MDFLQHSRTSCSCVLLPLAFRRCTVSAITKKQFLHMRMNRDNRPWAGRQIFRAVLYLPACICHGVRRSGLGVGPRAIATRDCGGVLCRIFADMIDALSDGCCEALESEAKSQADGYSHNLFVTVSFCTYDAACASLGAFRFWIRSVRS